MSFQRQHISRYCIFSHTTELTFVYICLFLTTCIAVTMIKDEVLLTVSSPIFPSILIAKILLTGSLKNRSIDKNAKEIYFNEKFPILWLFTLCKIEINFYKNSNKKMFLYETPDGIYWLNLSQSSRDTSQGTELVSLPMEERRR